MPTWNEVKREEIKKIMNLHRLAVAGVADMPNTPYHTYECIYSPQKCTLAFTKILTRRAKKNAKKQNADTRRLHIYTEQNQRIQIYIHKYSCRCYCRRRCRCRLHRRRMSFVILTHSHKTPLNSEMHIK